jgi:uncharacterized protein involved in outer membrane biogenesis
MTSLPRPLRILAIAVGIVAAIFAILLTIALNWDWDRSRPWLNERVSQEIGRDFAVRGHISLDWHRPTGGNGWRSYLPRPRLTANDVLIKNPEWARNPDFASIENISFDIGLLPLLARDVAISAIQVTKPAVDVERLADGRVNWTFKTRSGTPSTWNLKIDQIAFAAGQVTIIDKIRNIDAVATIRPVGEGVDIGALLDKSVAARNATAAAGGYGFSFDLKGTHNKAPLSGRGQFGGVLSLVDTSRPFPLQADVHVGDNHIVIAGTITDPGNLAALDLQLQLASGSMAHLYDLTGVTLPDTPPFSTRGHLSGRLHKADSVFRYEKFTGKVGSSDVAGTLTYTTAGVRPRLVGEVRSEKLLLADLGPLIGTANPAQKGKKVAVREEVIVKSGMTIPATPFRTERWKAMDADIKFVAGQIIRAESLPVSDLSAHVLLENGKLTLNPLKFGVAGGTLSGNIVLDSSSDPVAAHFNLSARRLRLKELLPTFEPMQTSFGQINGDADLHASGNMPSGLAASLDGDVKLLLVDGAVSGALLEQAGLNVANVVLDKLFGAKTVKINCAAANFVAKKGVLDARVFAIDTADALINVDGSVNLANEQMDLHVHPNTKGFRVFSLRSPLYVKGTFKDPKVGVEVGPLAARGAAAVGLGLVAPFAALLALVAPSNSSDSPCPAIVADATKVLKPVPHK